MNLWMSIFLSFFFCFKLEAKCDFKSYLTKIYSLSGPVTVALKEMGQLHNTKLKSISVFHPISEKEFHGSFLPGGVFLAQGSLEQFAGGLVFFDESRELSKILKPLGSVQGIEVVTRGYTPHEVTEKVIGELRPFMNGCDKEFEALVQKTRDLEKKILAILVKPLDVNFYLGEFRQGRPPEMIMVNDGIVKWLKDQKKIRTYPSELAYVNWSAKILQTMPQNTLQVAVKDSGKELKEQFVQTSQNVSFVYPGSLVPGISQLQGFLNLFEKLQGLP